MDALTDAGLGLDHDTLRLDRTTEAWLIASAALRSQIEACLGAAAAGVEQVGSSSVLGLLAKPIIDVAVGLPADGDLAEVTRRLEAIGWIYRGDAGEQGGHVFVLEARPEHRVAHLHVVSHEGAQWHDYLRLRDLLRRSPDARARYEAVKLRLAETLGHDRKAYTDAKSSIVSSLLRTVEGADRPSA